MNAKQLKNSILQWAIQGKLVPQDPNDEPASVLLEKIRAEKERLMKEGKLKKKEIYSSNIFKDDEGRWLETIVDITTDVSETIPFDVPNSWKWVRLKDIVSLITKGSSPSWQGVKYVDEGILFITSENVREGFLDLSSPKYLEEKFNDLQSRSILKKGDLLTNIVGASIGRTAEFNLELDNCNINQAVAIIRPIELSLNAFLLKVLNSPFVITQMIGKTVETARPNISLGSVENLFIPLPPLAEQHRIVAKIEELMPLVEGYGKAQDTLDEWNKSLPEKLKKSILQEAIQGRLVPQNPSDEPASALLERIRAEKARLASLSGRQVKEGQALPVGRQVKKKDLEVKPIEEDEIPFEIPKGWEWCKIEDITIPIGNKGNQIQSKEILNNGKVPVVSQGQKLIDGYSNEVDKIIKELPLVMFGDHTRNVKLIDFPFVIGADGTKFFKPILCDAQFIYYLVLHVASKLRDRGYARHYTLLKQETLPLPPLSEQKRIVAKVEELFGVIKK